MLPETGILRSGSEISGITWRIFFSDNEDLMFPFSMPETVCIRVLF
jgi:hypothetical protein